MPENTKPLTSPIWRMLFDQFFLATSLEKDVVFYPIKLISDAMSLAEDIAETKKLDAGKYKAADIPDMADAI
jgi:hypothetical protein